MALQRVTDINVTSSKIHSTSRQCDDRREFSLRKDDVED